MEEKKLTDEEIVKAWECHINNGIVCDKQCPYKEKGISCLNGRHARDTIDLIRRLQYGYSSASKASEEWREKYEKERKENAELTDEKEDLYFQNQNLQTYIDNHEPIWKRNTEQAVKDTAKEILAKAPTETNADERFIHWLRERYGVEVE